jgi:hypothetical protein
MYGADMDFLLRNEDDFQVFTNSRFCMLREPVLDIFGVVREKQTEF